MEKCKKCGCEIQQDAIFCHLCGASQQTKKIGKRMRGNGQGTAYKRGRTWTASFTIGWTDDNKPIKRTKGGFQSKRDALNYVPELKSKTCTRNNDASFKDIFEAWVPYYSPRIAAVTMKGLKSAYKWFDEIKSIAIAELTIDDLQDCIDECGKSKRTKENMKYLAVQLYKYAAARKVLTDNVAEFIYCGKNDNGTRPAFTMDQVEMIRKSIGIIPYADYTYCMIYTGFRPNEMLRLTKGSYDPINNCLVGGFKTEAGTNRPITVSPKIAPLISERIKKAKPWLFPDENGELMNDRYFREQCFYPLLDRLGIQALPDKTSPAYWRPYSCRHTFANLLKNVSGSDTDKAALMGHADASMTKQYQSFDYASLRAITDKI